MTNLNYRSFFLEVIGTKDYFVDMLGIEEYPIHTRTYTSPDNLSNILGNCINQIIFDDISPEDLKHFLSIVEKLTNDFINVVVHDAEFLLQNNVRVIIEDYKENSPSNYDVQLLKLDKKYIIMIEDYSQTKLNAVKELSGLIVDKLNISSNSEKSKTGMKIPLNISVADLALLFRLLVEERVISIDNNEALYRFIATNFASKKVAEISVASIKNKFLSPDNSSLKNIDALLVNMRQKLDKIQ